jgi:hypothetical protein
LSYFSAPAWMRTVARGEVPPSVTVPRRPFSFEL